jgi:ribosomal protein S27E
LTEILEKPKAIEKRAMPTNRPAYVDSYLEGIAGPSEEHGLGGHCINPKCDGQFDESMISPDGTVQCPTCQHVQNVNQSKDTPGGMTRSGLTMRDMGSIGEQVVLRMGEIPGVGAVHAASGDYNHAVDAIITGQRGNYGAEIKTNHSQAQERFKIGGKAERAEKITYCYQHGLKPALIGVRLNFYTDKAYIFFREGLTDTWIGNSQMIHAATVDFSDLNPFKSPDPQAQAMAIENANLPDQSTSDDEDFGFIAAKTAFDESDHPRADDGEFIVKNGTREVKVVHPKTGKHTHTAYWCKHCGHRAFIPSNHKGRIECPTCGEDLQRSLKLTKVRLGGPDPAHDMAQKLGFQFAGYASTGHRKFVMDAPNGVRHTVVVGSGAHGKDAQRIDADYARQRMNRCIMGQCTHGQSETLPEYVAPTETYALHPGQRVSVNGKEHYITDMDGGLAVVLDPTTGEENIAPIDQIQRLIEPQPKVAGERNPDFLFVYYNGKLRVEEHHHNKRFQDLLSRLLAESGINMDEAMMDLNPAEVAAGEVYEFEDGSVRVDHKQLAHEEVRERADVALTAWFETKDDVFGEGDVQPRDPDSGQFITEEEADAWAVG